eukprot:CAMPEP_0198238620 /NCGR_PEP_ID=MMETSP1446-20131203/4242_1 /TAXON_ID=1461542 ORGANISM="Unidentified sp, Strain CCMP2111" /NCGR_SAMPLE_ID=MMETSP1446 /ASSEMBLY_ACC=CAM_ASM_001112 /LENGTH=191 /DNA_ID=CAMNT_0043921077 /DNA_START=17 /DNA_END=589 /DNA_ORIENTATION=+
MKASMSGADDAAPNRDIMDLLGIAEESKRGIDLSSKQKSRVEAICSRLNGDVTDIDVKSNLSATWKMLFTTEKETLFILKTAGFFGNKSEVFQTISVPLQKLQNLIRLDSSSSFVVDSTISFEEDSDRANFSFTSASVSLPGKSRFELPPYGSGWFDTLYIDGRYRLARDSRDDILLVENVGPPTFFTNNA